MVSILCLLHKWFVRLFCPGIQVTIVYKSSLLFTYTLSPILVSYQFHSIHLLLLISYHFSFLISSLTCDPGTQKKEGKWENNVFLPCLLPLPHPHPEVFILAFPHLWNGTEKFETVSDGAGITYNSFLDNTNLSSNRLWQGVFVYSSVSLWELVLSDFLSLGHSTACQRCKGTVYFVSQIQSMTSCLQGRNTMAVGHGGGKGAQLMTPSKQRGGRSHG